MKKYLFAILAFLWILNTFAQSTDWVVYNTSNSELPHNNVKSIAIDKYGNKWIGTWQNGVAKFNDSIWTIYDTSNSDIINNMIYTIMIDEFDNKWFGVINAVSIFNNSNWSYFNPSNSPINGAVYTIVKEKSGVMWFAAPTSNGGLFRLEDTVWTIYNSSNSFLPNNSSVIDIVIDDSNTKWISTQGHGLFKFDDTNWTNYNTSNSGLPHSQILVSTIDSFGVIWIGTNGGGLAKFDGSNWTVYNTSNSGLPHDNVHTINFINEYDIWIGTNGGVANFDGSNWIVYNTSNSDLPFNSIRALVIDENLNKWIGTLSGGLAVLKANYDVGIVELVSFADSLCGSDDYDITVKLVNHGNMKLEDFEVSAIISGYITDTISATYSNTLIPGDTVDFTIGTFNPGSGGNIDILAFTSLENDSYRNNDTISFRSHFFSYPPIPDVQDDSLCQGEVVTLTGTNTDNLTKWYLSSSSSFVLHTGSSYTIPKISNTMWYNVINFNENNCPSDVKGVKVTVNSLPDIPDIIQGVIFEGHWNAGTIQEADEVCAGNTISYEFPPPAGYNNSEFGDKWGISVSLMTSDGNLASSFNFIDPVAGNNANLTFTASTSEADSIFNLTAEYILYPSLCTETVNRYVKVNHLPQVDFTFDDPCENSSTSFTSTSAIASGNLIAYEWDFGDGNTSTFLGPANTYFVKGTYSVRLKVTSDALCVNETTKEIDIYEMPQADFETDLACATDSLHFINLTTYSEGNGVLNYEWDFGLNNENSTDFEPGFKYVNPDTYTVSLKAISPDGCVNVISKNLEVFEKPHAEFEVEDACAGSELILNNQSEGKELSSHWSFGDGNEASGHEPGYVYETPAEYEINLIVTDANGCSDQFTSPVNIFELPDAGFTRTESMGKAAFFPNNTAYVSYEWDFGDGNSSTDISPEHEYAENGSFEVSLKVEDENGCINEEVKMIDMSSVSIETSEISSSLNLKIYPNPFTNETVISYELYENTEVSIVLLDLTGRKLADIDNGSKTAGTHTVILNSSEAGIADGMYMIHMQAGSEIFVGRVVKW